MCLQYMTACLCVRTCLLVHGLESGNGGKGTVGWTNRADRAYFSPHQCAVVTIYVFQVVVCDRVSICESRFRRTPLKKRVDNSSVKLTKCPTKWAPRQCQNEAEWRPISQVFFTQACAQCGFFTSCVLYYTIGRSSTVC